MDRVIPFRPPKGRANEVEAKQAGRESRDVERERTPEERIRSRLRSIAHRTVRAAGEHPRLTLAMAFAAGMAIGGEVSPRLSRRALAGMLFMIATLRALERATKAFPIVEPA